MNTVLLANRIRQHVLQMVYQARASHIGSCYSVADILAVLYGKVMRFDPMHPDEPNRDRFILSKGHAGAAVYATLAEVGFFDKELLATYCQNDSHLLGHLTKTVPGVEVSTGSLGHGFPIAVGMAVAAKRDKKSHRVFIVLSDGELNEGSNWEAIMLASALQLDNLVVIVDYNKWQGLAETKCVIDLEPMAKKWEAFHFACIELDGHDHTQLENVLSKTPLQPDQPTVIIAHTTKGKGVSFMEDQLAWHYQSPNKEQFEQAMQQLSSNVL